MLPLPSSLDWLPRSSLSSHNFLNVHGMYSHHFRCLSVQLGMVSALLHALEAPSQGHHWAPRHSVKQMLPLSASPHPPQHCPHSLWNITISWGLLTFLVALSPWVLVPDPPVGVLRVLTKSLLSHPVFSLCHSFNRLLYSEDSPALLRLYPTFYQTAPLGYMAVTNRIHGPVAQVRSKFISLSHHSPEFAAIPGRAGGSMMLT